MQYISIQFHSICSILNSSNPNEHSDGEQQQQQQQQQRDREQQHNSRQERGRYKQLDWTAYESFHKKYLSFGEYLGHLFNSLYEEYMVYGFFGLVFWVFWLLLFQFG